MCRAFVLANRKHHQVAIFPNTLWHGVAPSFALDEEGQGVRRSVTLRYGQMWSRPYLLRPILVYRPKNLNRDWSPRFSTLRDKTRLDLSQNGQKFEHRRVSKPI